MRTILLLFLSFGSIASTSPDDSLPVYMRGVNWDKVQEYVKEDLRLSDAVNPLDYSIELSVNVRDHEGAQRSDFNGTVIIALNFTKSTDHIELHSNGLSIEKVALLESVALEPPPSVAKYSIDKERETIVIHPNRTIEEGEEFLLKITYSGVAIMNEYGLYENWDPKWNKTLDHNGSFVLVTNSYPTGARFWFPCFDEPQRKATFDLRVDHPKALNVYSNTEIQRTESDSDSKRITSIFAKTQLLSTYQLTLSVNHFPVDNLGEVHGFKRVRVISSLNNPEEQLKEIQRDIIHIIILDGTFLFTVNPGLVMFGRYNYFGDLKRREYAGIDIPPISNFTNIIVGSQISVQSVDQQWLNDMFGLYYAKEPYYSVARMVREIPHEIFYSSLHEKPLRESSSTLSSTTSQFLRAKRQEPALKASQILKVIHRLCPAANEAFEKYMVESRGKFADIDRFARTVSDACSENEAIKAFMNDFIDQPGRAFLTVTRRNNTVEINQTRYRLAIDKTRYTIPIFVNIDGKEHVKILRKNETSLTFSLKPDSTFIVDSQYDRLYFVFYKDFLHYSNVTEEEQIQLQYNHRKSLLSALEQGAIKYDEFVLHAVHYINQSVFEMTNVHTVFWEAARILALRSTYTSPDDFLSGYCKSLRLDHPMSWDGLFNNDTSRYWQIYFSLNSDSSIYQRDDWNMVQKVICLTEWHNSSTYLKFLEKNFFGDSTQIRPSLMKAVKLRSESDNMHRKELHQFFFRNAGNFTDPRWNLLADAVFSFTEYHWFEDDYSEEMRNFVRRNPRRAASMANEIEMRMEREYIRKERAKWHGVDRERLSIESNQLTNIAANAGQWSISLVSTANGTAIVARQLE